MSIVWHQADIANALLSVYAGKVQVLDLLDDTAQATMYRNGVRDALAATALLFGINPGLVLPETLPKREIP